MIVSCICGKYEFEVNKNDIPKEGRNVQCGICNETWFQTPHEKKGKLPSTKTNHYFAHLFLLLLIFISVIGVMETFRDDLLYNIPELERYYNYIENSAENVIEKLKYLFSSLSIRYKIF